MDCSNSPPGGINPTGRLDVAVHKTNFDPNHPLFYLQFSSSKPKHELTAALANLKSLSPFQLATLHFIPGTCYELQVVIIQNIQAVLTSTNRKEMGPVFIHLIKSINEIQQNLRNDIYTSYKERSERINLLQSLTKQVHKLNKAGVFRDLVLSNQSLSHLDFTDLFLDLSFANFNHAYLVNTNFTNTILTHATFYEVDLSSVIGMHLSSSESDTSGYSEEQQNSDSFAEAKPKIEKCLIN